VYVYTVGEERCGVHPVSRSDSSVKIDVPEMEYQPEDPTLFHYANSSHRVEICIGCSILVFLCFRLAERGETQVQKPIMLPALRPEAIQPRCAS
jgi:hypothetical protein